MASVRFLQLSDLHLGAPFLWLPADRREDRRRDQRHVLEHAVLEAIERGVDAILIPGDLFDQEDVDAGTLAFALGAFAASGCPPVFIAPGNHDPYFERSLYWNERLLQARNLRWPPHVHIFTSAEWSARPLPRQPVVRLWGRSFHARVESLERPLAEASFASVTRADPLGLDLALFHGSREGRCPPGQKMTAPFSDAEAAAGPFAYMAVGHYHASSRFEMNQGVAAGARLAYAGSTAAVYPHEIGPHGALEVRIEYGRRQPFVEVEFVELDPRRVHDVTLEVPLANSPEQIDRRVQKALDDAGVRPEDIVTVHVAGRVANGVRVSGPGPELRGLAFHLRFDLSRLRPDYDLEVYRQGGTGTTEERFARALIEQRDQETDPARRALIESALYYGLDAFRNGQVDPAYEEIGE